MRRTTFAGSAILSAFALGMLILSSGPSFAGEPAKPKAGTEKEKGKSAPAKAPKDGKTTPPAAPEPAAKETEAAAPEKPAKAEGTEIEPIEIVGKRSLLTFPGTVDLLRQKDWEFSKPTSVQEALRNVPGFFAGEEDPRGLFPGLRIRGLGDARSHDILFFIDGVPEGQMLWGYTDAHVFVPAQQLERIEVIKGGASVQYGPCTVAGVVNMISHAIPKDPELYVSEKISVHPSTPGPASVDTVVRAGGTFGNTGVLVNYVNRVGHGYREVNDSFQVNDFLAKVRISTDPTSGLEARFNYFTVSEDTPRGLNLAAFQKDPHSTQDTWSAFAGQRYQGSVAYDKDFGDAGSLRVIVYGQMMERNWWRATTPFPPTGTDGRVQFYNFAGINPTYAAAFPFLGMKHEIKTGARLHADREVTHRLTCSTGDARMGTTNNIAYNDSVSLSWFLEDRIDFGGGTSVTPGIRIESFRYLMRDFTTQGKRTVGQTEPVFSLGAFQEIGRGGAFVNVCRTLRPVKMEELINHYTYLPQDVHSSFAMQYEGGFRSNHVTGVTGELSAFLIDFQDLPQATLVPGEYIQVGRAWHGGVELGLEADSKAIDASLAGVGLTMNAMYLFAEMKEGTYKGNRVPYAPEWSGSAGLYFQKWGFRAELGGRFVDNVFHDLANTQSVTADGKNGKIPSYHVWHLTLEYKFNEGPAEFSLFGGVENLLDRDYYTYRSTSSGPILPSPGRTFNVGASVKF